MNKPQKVVVCRRAERTSPTGQRLAAGLKAGHNRCKKNTASPTSAASRGRREANKGTSPRQTAAFALAQAAVWRGLCFTLALKTKEPSLVKNILTVLGIIVLGIGVLIGVIFYATSGVVETADSFFKAVADGNFNTARSHLSEEFKASTSKEEFQAFLEESALTEFAEAFWHNRSVSIGSGTLEGEVTTKSGGTIPLTMAFVKEDSGWKIYSIQKSTAGLQSASNGSLAIPSKTEAAQIVDETTLDFANAVNAKDFSEFHAQMAKELKEQYSVAQLTQIFQPFISQELDLTVLQNFEPMFTSEPALSAEGVLQLEGYYPTTPSRAHFTYKYVYRFTSWKLISVNINLKPIEG
jgi:hypothetical protein